MAVASDVGENDQDFELSSGNLSECNKQWFSMLSTLQSTPGLFRAVKDTGALDCVSCPKILCMLKTTLLC